MADEKKLNTELTDDEANEAAGRVFRETIGGIMKTATDQFAQVAETAATAQTASGWEQRRCSCGRYFTVKKSSRQKLCTECRKPSSKTGGLF